MTPAQRLRVGVLGGSGYTGGELCRLLLSHPDVELIVPSARGDAAFERVHRHLAGSELRFLPPEQLLAREDIDVMFFSTPTGEAMRHAPGLLDRGVLVIDLSADFRFRDSHVFERAHRTAHTCPELLGQAAAGITELHRTQVAGARLVANPGCYVMATVLGLTPLLLHDMVDPRERVHVAAVNGTSGAGSKPRAELMHAEVFGSMLPYNLDGHRHAAEIDMHINQQGMRPLLAVDLTTAHGDFVRGIYAQISVPLRFACDRHTLMELFGDHYGLGHSKEFFVLPNDQPRGVGQSEKQYDIYPSLAAVRGSNFCHIGFDVDRDTGTAKIVSVLDNLVKGAAGSAIQNMNVALGLDERAGLRSYGI